MTDFTQGINNDDLRSLHCINTQPIVSFEGKVKKKKEKWKEKKKENRIVSLGQLN